MKNRFASAVFHNGYIYGFDESIFACIDAATGDLKWKGGRYGYGQVLLAGDHLIVLSEEGDLALVRATPERHDELARFPAISGKTWNHPALADGILLVQERQRDGRVRPAAEVALHGASMPKANRDMKVVKSLKTMKLRQYLHHLHVLHGLQAMFEDRDSADSEDKIAT